MIIIKSFGSGSSGNLYLVQTKNANIILECGVKQDKINKMLIENNLNYTDINACLISHFHTDHACSINKIEEYMIPIYCTYQTATKYKINNYTQLLDNNMIKIKGLSILPFSVNHGDSECFGFIFYEDKKNITLFATDFMNFDSNLSKLQFKEIFIECNYIEGLWNKINEEDKNIKFLRQINTHQSLENLVLHLQSLDLSNCEKINLIHLSKDLSDYRVMIDTIVENFGIYTIALDNKGKELE